MIYHVRTPIGGLGEASIGIIARKDSYHRQNTRREYIRTLKSPSINFKVKLDRLGFTDLWKYFADRVGASVN